MIGIFRSSLTSTVSPGAQNGRLTNLMATDADSVGNATSLVWAFSQWTFSVCVLPAVIYLMWAVLQPGSNS